MSYVCLFTVGGSDGSDGNDGSDVGDIGVLACTFGGVCVVGAFWLGHVHEQVWRIVLCGGLRRSGHSGICAWQRRVWRSGICGGQLRVWQRAEIGVSLQPSGLDEH